MNLINEVCEAEQNIVGIIDHIERVRWIGRYQDNKNRLIVVNSPTSGSGKVSEHLDKSSKTNSTIYENNFLEEFVEKRKALMPVLRKAFWGKQKGSIEILQTIH